MCNLCQVFFLKLLKYLTFFSMWYDNKCMEGIGKRLKILRTELALKQGEFAEQLGISQSALSDFEREFKPIAERYIKLICLTFNANGTWLRTGEGEMFDKKPEFWPWEPSSVGPDGETLTLEEEIFIKTYQQLTETNKEVAKTTLDALLKAQGKVAEK